MSVLSEINRIKDAVTAIVNAIKSKGVTVPTTAKIDDLAPLILDIVPNVETATPQLWIEEDEGDVAVRVLHIQEEGYVEEKQTHIEKYLTLTADGNEVIVSCDNAPLARKGVANGTLPTPTMVFFQDTGIVRATVSFEDSGTPGYIAMGDTRKTYDVAQHIDPTIIKKGEKLFGKTGEYEGGASIKTCNITINIVDSVGYIGVTATQFANDAITNFAQSKSSGTFTIPDVVCGSIITIVCSNYFSIDGWAYELRPIGSSSNYLKAPTTTGDYSANIIAYDD